MDYLGIGGGYAVAVLILFAVCRYFYLNIKQDRFWIAVRNFLFLCVFLAGAYYMANYSGMDIDPCYSYDARGICNE